MTQIKNKERIMSPELKKRIGKILESTKSFANNPFYIATKKSAFGHRNRGVL